MYIRRPLALLSVCLCFLIAFGFFLNRQLNESFYPSMKSADFVCRVTNKDISGDYAGITVRIIKFSNPIQKYFKNRLITIPYNEIEYDNSSFNRINIGDRLCVNADINVYYHATNPGEFDQKDYYDSLRIAGNAKNCRVIIESHSPIPLREELFNIRLAVRKRIYSVFSKESAGIICAMLLGDKSGLSGDIKRLYANSGIIHILSISGLHISLIGLGLYKALRKCRMHIVPATSLSFMILLSYGIMTGMSLSATRAISMFFIRMLAISFRRTYDMLTAVSVSCLFMLIINPGVLLNSGFYLSYGSVLGIALLKPELLTKRNRKDSKYFYQSKPLSKTVNAIYDIGYYITDALLSSLAITLFTAPALLYFYYEIPTFSFMVNLIIIPFMSIIMFGTLFVACIPGTGIFGTVTELVLLMFKRICLLYTQIPGNTLICGRPKLWKIWIYYIILCSLIFIYNRKILNRCRILSFCVCLALLLAPHKPVNQVAFLDVGQGDCAVVFSKTGETFVIDCGSTTKRNVGENILVNYLKYSGRRRVDAIFVSHEDADHINGIDEVAAEYNCEVTDTLYQKEEYISKRGKNRIEIKCLWPVKGFMSDNANESSMVLLMHLNDTVIMFTGDLCDRGEEETVKYYSRIKKEVGRVDILKVAHHGSNYSTKAEFLTETMPQIAVISVGKNNSYGHPGKELTERLAFYGAEIKRTDEDGAIIFSID